MVRWITWITWTRDSGKPSHDTGFVPTFRNHVIHVIHLKGSRYLDVRKEARSGPGSELVTTGSGIRELVETELSIRTFRKNGVHLIL